MIKSNKICIQNSLLCKGIERHNNLSDDMKNELTENYQICENDFFLIFKFTFIYPNIVKKNSRAK